MTSWREISCACASFITNPFDEGFLSPFLVYLTFEINLIVVWELIQAFSFKG